MYEWGNPMAKNMPSLEANEQVIANSAYRWRKKLQTDPKSLPITGAFENFRVILRTTKNENLQNLIEAGGGVVVKVR